ncbi:hypothetical protein KQI84_18920 [bacterium]|nr:hypothetical protein [bacterium]
MESQQEHQREYDRIPIRARVTLYLLRPNDSFTPLVIKGVATDFCESGMRVKTPLIGEGECRELGRDTCLAKIELSQTGRNKSPKLKGELFWVRYHPETPEERAHAELGFRLTQVDEETSSWLREHPFGD